MHLAGYLAVLVVLLGFGAFAVDLAGAYVFGMESVPVPADLAAERLDFQPIPEGSYGLGVFDYGNGWIGHSGQIIGWESIVYYDTDTGAAFTAIVNDTGNATAAELVAYAIFPDLLGL